MRINVQSPSGPLLPNALYSRAIATRSNIIEGESTIPYTLASTTMVARGRPFLILASGDAQNMNETDWCRLAIFRDIGDGFEQISNIVQIESIGANANTGYGLSAIDTTAPAITPGITITYALRVTYIAGELWFGEEAPPEFNVIEI
jgi:hypothetical protein